MKTVLGLLTLIALLIAYSTAKNFWSGALDMLVREEVEAGSEKVEKIIMETPTPTSTSTSTTSTGPCSNGCIPPTVGTANAPTAPPPYNTSYNGRNPLISSYPTTQP